MLDDLLFMFEFCNQNSLFGIDCTNFQNRNINHFLWVLVIEYWWIVHSLTCRQLIRVIVGHEVQHRMATLLFAVFAFEDDIEIIPLLLILINSASRVYVLT